MQINLFIGFKEFQFNGRNYFFSGHDKELKDQKTDWLDSRNTCRERCMETVSFETQEEFDFVKKYIEEKNIKFIWTSGRLCGIMFINLNNIFFDKTLTFK